MKINSQQTDSDASAILVSFADSPPKKARNIHAGPMAAPWPPGMIMGEKKMLNTMASNDFLIQFRLRVFVNSHACLAKNMPSATYAAHRNKTINISQDL
jgi:hypothetical protein